MNTSDSHKYQQEQINLNGGDVKLFRRGTYGNWQIKIWIRENNKYYRKSLRTRDENLARVLAEDEYLEIKSKRRSGEKEKRKGRGDATRGEEEKTLEWKKSAVRVLCWDNILE